MERFGRPQLSYGDWLSKTKGTLFEFLKSQGIATDPNEVAPMHQESLRIAMKNGLHPTAYPDALNLLSVLQELNIPIAVLSSHPTEILIEEAQGYGILKYFTEFKGGVTNKASALTEMSKALRMHPSKLIYLGDMESDGEAANKAGYPFFGITSGYHPRERLEKHNPVAIANTLTEVGEILRLSVRP